MSILFGIIFPKHGRCVTALCSDGGDGVRSPILSGHTLKQWMLTERRVRVERTLESHGSLMFPKPRPIAWHQQRQNISCPAGFTPERIGTARNNGSIDHAAASSKHLLVCGKITLCETVSRWFQPPRSVRSTVSPNIGLRTETCQRISNVSREAYNSTFTSLNSRTSR